MNGAVFSSALRSALGGMRSGRKLFRSAPSAETDFNVEGKERSRTFTWVSIGEFFEEPSRPGHYASNPPTNGVFDAHYGNE